MKKLIVLFTAFLALSVNAQKEIKEGVITLKQTMSSDNEQMNAQLQSMGGTNSVAYVKNNKTRTETSNPMSGDMTIIIDGDQQEMLMLMSQAGMGKKYMKQSIEVSDEDLEKVKVEKGDKTKTVLGYECQQYIVNMNQNGQNMAMEFYTTDKISAISQNTTAMGDKIKGYPLYYITRVNQMGANIEVITEVTKIEEKPVADEKFSMTPPEGYTDMSTPQNPMLENDNKN